MKLKLLYSSVLTVLTAMVAVAAPPKVRVVAIARVGQYERGLDPGGDGVTQLIQSDLWLGLDLVDPVKLIFDRVLDGNDLSVGGIDLV